MFEAAILPATAQSDGVLRPLDWSELVARFSATRDLRALVRRPADAGSSFAARAATGLPHGHDEPAVNLGDLEAMKPLAIMNAATTLGVAESDQGRQ